MSRQTTNLDGDWRFAFAPDVPTTQSWGPDAPDQGPTPPADCAWRTIRVPGPWSAQFEDLRLSTGTAWYRRSLQIPAQREDGARVLHFGAVNYQCRVWWNEHFLGQHEGGYLPFEVDMTDCALPGEVGELTVRVVMPSNDPALYPDFPFAEIPHGKQSWYGPLGGIWQSVTLEQRPHRHLTGVRITPQPVQPTDFEEWTVRVDLATNRPPAHGDRFRAQILDPAGIICAQAESAQPTLEIPVSDPRLWDLDDPALYTLQVVWHPAEAGSAPDILSDTFGFRTFHSRDGLFYLNGRPIYLRGALDQDYYPDLIATPPSQAYIEDQFRQAKAMGLNCLRVHIKVPDPCYFAAADRVGLLIWAELPNFQQLTDRSAAHARRTLSGMLRRDGNHPSIVIWTIINEDWGTELVTNPDHRAWLGQMVAWLRAQDPTRLVVDNSPCFPNHHVSSDVDDFHFYAAMPDNAAQWEAWMDDMAGRGDFLYAPDHQPDPNAAQKPPLVVSEFGNWGLPDLRPLLELYGGEPWWFDTGWEWSDGDVYPRGVVDRFQAMRLDKTFGDFAGLAQVSQAAQVEALKYEIESMRWREALAGYIITEWADTHWEANGLLDMVRQPKRIAAELARFNGDSLIVPRLARRAFWCGQEMTVTLHLSHFGPTPIASAKLVWTLDHPDHGPVSGEIPHLFAQPGQVVTLPPLVLTAPHVERPIHSRLQLALVEENGAMICENAVTVGIFPRLSASDLAVIGTVTCLETDLADELAQAGYGVNGSLSTTAMSTTAPLVMTRLDDAARRHVERGGRALLLAGDEDAIRTQLPRFGIDLRRRAGTPWAGDWASSLAWFRKERFAAALPSDRWLDFTCASVIPELVIANLRTPEWEENVLAGLFVGWLRRPAALVLRFSLGRGELLVTTLRLAGQIATDPVAAHFFHAHLLDLSPATQ